MVHGTEKIGRVLEKNCDLARGLAEQLPLQTRCRIAFPVVSNTVLAAFGNSDVTEHVFRELWNEGIILPSLARYNGEAYLRFCLLNHRTGPDTVEKTVNSVKKILQEKFRN
jgi:threonine aldolase